MRPNSEWVSGHTRARPGQVEDHEARRRPDARKPRQSRATAQERGHGQVGTVVAVLWDGGAARWPGTLGRAETDRGDDHTAARGRVGAGSSAAMRSRRAAAVIAPAPTRPVGTALQRAGLRVALTAVQELLVLTRNPWKKPAATLLARVHRCISWFGVHGVSPLRVPQSRQGQEMVSVNGSQRVMPSAPATSSPGPDQATPGNHVSGGKPLRGGRERGTASWAAAITEQCGGGDQRTTTRARARREHLPGGTACRTRKIRARANTRRLSQGRRAPSRRRRRHARAKPATSPRNVLAVDRSPDQLRRLARDGEGRAVHVADLGRLGEQGQRSGGQPGHGMMAKADQQEPLRKEARTMALARVAVTPEGQDRPLQCRRAETTGSGRAPGCLTARGGVTDQAEDRGCRAP